MLFLISWSVNSPNRIDCWNAFGNMTPEDDLKDAGNDIKINCLAPTAATRMTEDVLNEEMLAQLDPKFVTPAAIYLVSKEAPTRKVMFAGGGTYSILEIRESKGQYLNEVDRNPEAIATNIDKISDMSEAEVYTQGMEHISKVLSNVKK